MTAQFSRRPDMEILREAREWRRELHRHPELAYHEKRTSDLVAERLAAFGLVVHRGLAETGVVGTMSRGTARRTIGVRADMDALPIQELGSAAHASLAPGCMHACGHDGHTAILLAAAEACAGMDGLDGTVHFIFQPAEENEGGGRRMVAEGLFELFPCDEIYALHNWPALPVGEAVARDGAMMAAMATFEIEIAGQGCHAAMPHQGADPVLAAAHLVTALQGIVSRNVDPLETAVISVTQIHGGDTFNVVPGCCVLRGTARWFDESVADLLEERVRSMSAIAKNFGCRASVAYERRLPATINDPKCAADMRSVIADIPSLTVVEAAPSMSSEDFSFMLGAVPGCYLWLGSGSPTHPHNLHSPFYDFNDAIISSGVELWKQLVQTKLGDDS